MLTKDYLFWHWWWLQPLHGRLMTAESRQAAECGSKFRTCIQFMTDLQSRWYSFNTALVQWWHRWYRIYNCNLLTSDSWDYLCESYSLDIPNLNTEYIELEAKENIKLHLFLNYDFREKLKSSKLTKFCWKNPPLFL